MHAVLQMSTAGLCPSYPSSTSGGRYQRVMICRCVHLPGGERVCAGYLLGQLADGRGERAPESKIRQFRDRSIGIRCVDQDVVRLEVSMHQAHRVAVVQSQEDVVHEPL